MWGKKLLYFLPDHYFGSTWRSCVEFKHIFQTSQEFLFEGSNQKSSSSFSGGLSLIYQKILGNNL